VEATFNRSPKISVWKASCDLQMSKTTVWQVLDIQVHMKPYKCTMIDRLEPEDCPKRKYFREPFQAEMDNAKTIVQCLAFSNEATFYTSSKVNRHNLHVWEHQRDSPL
jgi:hypothetical protein